MEKKKIIYSFCYLKIRPTKNNIFVTLTTANGNVIAKSSAGMADFTGKKKSTPYVASIVVKELMLSLSSKNIKIRLLVVQTLGYLRNHAFKRSIEVLQDLEIDAYMGVDNFPRYSHNGMRLRKSKRV